MLVQQLAPCLPVIYHLTKKFCTFKWLAPLCLRILSRVSCFLLGGSNKWSLYIWLFNRSCRSGSFWLSVCWKDISDWQVSILSVIIADTWNDEDNFFWKCVWIYIDIFYMVLFSHHDNAQVDRPVVSPELGPLETHINLDYFLHMFNFLPANTPIPRCIVLIQKLPINNN